VNSNQQYKRRNGSTKRRKIENFLKRISKRINGIPDEKSRPMSKLTKKELRK